MEQPAQASSDLRRGEPELRPRAAGATRLLPGQPAQVGRKLRRGRRRLRARCAEADRPSRVDCRNEERTPPATASSAVRPTAAPAASTVSGFGGRPLAPLRLPQPRALSGNCGPALSTAVGLARSSASAVPSPVTGPPRRTAPATAVVLAAACDPLARAAPAAGVSLRRRAAAAPALLASGRCSLARAAPTPLVAPLTQGLVVTWLMLERGEAWVCAGAATADVSPGCCCWCCCCCCCCCCW